MREILFRGKRCDNGEWVQGDLLHPDLYGNGYSIEDFTKDKNNCFDVIPETVGQYTGLTDKNGKRIFEGDIVHLTDIRYENEWKAVVVFGNPYCQYGWGWNLQYIGKKPQINTDILLWVEMEDVQVYCEVIGNIHDNPEMLGGADNG